MPFEETRLSQRFELVKLSVSGSTQISARTTAVIAKLEPKSNDGKPVIVTLTAKARAASKLVSIVEIAKRELAAKGQRCFQYTALASEMIEIKRHTRTAAAVAAEFLPQEAESDSDDAFETMNAQNENGLKKRQGPTLTVYLSTSSVKELKNEFG